MRMASLAHYIAGAWRKGSGSAFKTIDPCTGQDAFTAHMVGTQDLQDAINAASSAYHLWSRYTLESRIAILKQFEAKLTMHTELLAKTIAQETGKPYWEAKQEVSSMISKIDLSITAYHARTGFHEYNQGAATFQLQHKPHGIIAVIGPYNFPGHLPNGHIIPALLAGNVVIFKPSELTPQTAMVISRLWHATALPKGVLQVVQGDAHVGKFLADSDVIRGLLFTGSFVTGQQLHRQLAGQVNKLLVLEMGGHNPLIVWDESLIDETVANIITSAFISTGQRCTCARRLILPNNHYGDTVLKALIKAVKRIKQTEPFVTPEPFMGPLISAASKNKVIQAIETWSDLGITPALACKISDDNSGWITPGIYIDETGSVPDEEVFGPVLVIQRADDFDQAMVLANNTAFGLAAGLISPSLERYQQFVAEIQAGVLAWNKPLTGASSQLPFGGLGQSGNYRPSAWYAADYCAAPMAAQLSTTLTMPPQVENGLLRF